MEQILLVDELRDWLVRQRDWALGQDGTLARQIQFWIVSCHDAAKRLENADPGNRGVAASDVDALLGKAFAFAQENARRGAPARRALA